MAHRPFVWIFGSVALGILLGEDTSPPLTLALCTVLLLLNVAGFCVEPLRRAQTWLLCTLIAGLAAAWTATRDTAPRIEGRFVARVRGTVSTEPIRDTVSRPLGKSGKQRLRFTLSAESVRCDNGQWKPLRMKLATFLYEAGDFDLRYGDRLEAVGTLSEPQPAANPGQFDYARYSQRKGISGTLSVCDPACVWRIGIGGNPFIRALGAAKEHLRTVIRQHTSPVEGGALDALILGEMSQIEPDIVALFRRTGTIHFLVVSGLHVSLVAATVWLVFRLVPFPGILQQTAPPLAVACYAVFVGLDAPVARAAWMTLVYLAAQALKKRQETINTTAFAGAGILLYDPMQIHDAGFQLTFAAVFGILYLHGPIKSLLGARRYSLEEMIMAEDRSLWRRLAEGIRRYLADSACVSLAAWLGVAPVIARVYFIVTPATVIANILVVFLMSIAVASGFGFLATAPLWENGAILWLKLSELCLYAFRVCVEALDRLPLSSVTVPPPSLFSLGGYYAVLALLILYHRTRRTPALLSALVLANVVLWSGIRPAEKETRFTALSVGHGAATVFEFPRATVVYDAGSYAPYDVGSRIVVPYLLGRSRKTVDLLILSHGDADHVNAVPAMLDNLRVQRVIYPPGLTLTSDGAEVVRLLDGRGIAHGAVSVGARVAGLPADIEILSPREAPGSRARPDPNETSIVMRVRAEGRTFLLCGDATEAVVGRLLLRPEALQADVVLLPHHGGALRNSRELALAAKPRYAIVSSTEAFPSSRTLEDFRSAGAAILETSREGAVTIRVRKGALDVCCFSRAGPAEDGSIASLETDRGR